MYFKLVDDQTQSYSIEQLRADNPQVSFPEHPSEALLKEYSVYPFTVKDQPSYDPMTQHTVEGSIVQDVDGSWGLSWSVESLPNDTASNNIRKRRDFLLSESDWVVVKASEYAKPISSSWLTYRQALRDVTLQEGFPYSVIWPNKPE